MSAMANLVAFDGATVPVSHTFTPISQKTEKGVTEAYWRELNAALPIIAQNRVTVSTQTLKSGVIKTELRVVVPVMEAVAGANAAGYTAAPKVAFEDTVIVTSFNSARSSTAHKRLARVLAGNILEGQTLSEVVTLVGPGPEAFDSGIVPN